MKKIIALSVVALSAFVVAPPASALEWNDEQVVFMVSGEQQVAENGLGMRGTFFNFRIPAAGVNTDIVYAGPSLTKVLGCYTLWIAPQFLAATNYLPGKNSLGPSLWASLSTEWFSLFAEGDWYFGKSHGATYYGFYVFDYRLASWLGSARMPIRSIPNSGMAGT